MGFKSRFRIVNPDTALMQGNFPADFRNGKIEGVDFSKFNIENSCFVNATLTNCDFSGCNLEGVDFYGATFDNCNFVGVKICTNGPASWHTVFPKDLTKCVFDNEGVKKLQALHKMSEDAQKRADAWVKKNPARQPWEPGSKLDSPWN